MDMSLAFLKVDGNGGKSRFISRCRNQPVLQRNLRKSLRFLVMSSTLSALRTPPGLRSQEKSLSRSNDDDGEDIRPSKRRKVVDTVEEVGQSSSRFPFGQVTDENINMNARADSSSKIKLVQPPDFYRRSGSITSESGTPKTQIYHASRSKIGDIVPRMPANFKKALRVEVGSVVHTAAHDEATNELRGIKDSIDVTCRCSVELLSGQNDHKPNARIDPTDYTVNFRKSSTCILRTTLDAKGVAKRELVNLEPFVVPAEEFLVNRKKRDREGFVESFELAEKHWMKVTIEPVGPQAWWPPFDRKSLENSWNVEDGSYEKSNPVLTRLALNKSTMNQAFLLTQVNEVLDPDRQDKCAPLKLCCGHDRHERQKIPYALKVGLKWSLPSHMSEWARNIQIESGNSQSKLASVLPDPSESRARTVEDLPLVDAQSTPMDTRAQRRRANVPTYNLKKLSEIQQGRSPSINQPRDLRSNIDSENYDDVTIRVAYTLFADVLKKQGTVVTGYTCLFCARSHVSLNDLAFHIRMAHNDWKSTLRSSNANRAVFLLKLARQGARSSSVPKLEQSRTLQLSQPRSIFDLENFIGGDESWTRSRKGPQHDSLPDHVQERVSSSPSSPYNSRQSSPNTSYHTDGDVLGPEKYITKMPIRPRKKFYVPRSTKPLFDTVTKQILVPGTEIPNSDEEKDESWLYQKHRDIIMDFTDVTEDEKDYILRWNSYIMELHLTCETYLSSSVLEFVETNKFWFKERNSRKRELAKSIESFIMRGVATEECFDKCVEILKQAEKTEPKEKEPEEQERPISPSKHRGALDCECGDHTEPSNRVICRSKTCRARFFHRQCAEKSGRYTRGAWICDVCFS